MTTFLLFSLLVTINFAGICILMVYFYYKIKSLEKRIDKLEFRISLAESLSIKEAFMTHLNRKENKNYDINKFN